MIVNFVISKDLKSRIFYDIFARFIAKQGSNRIVISEAPVASADVYHYHRIHLEECVKSPSVATVHHDLTDVDPWLPGHVFLDRFRQVDKVICLNSLQKEYLQALGIAHTEIIPHGYDEILFKRIRKDALNATEKRKMVLGLTSKRYDRRFKGEVYLYDLASRLSPQDFKFLLVGEGRSQDAMWLRRLGFEVDVFEWLPYRLFPLLYESIDFLLMVSNFEGGPANIPEAVATGTPLLCTRVGMAADFVTEGVNGIYLSGSAAADIDKFEELARPPRRLFKQLTLGAQKYRKIPSWNDVINMHFKLYESITSAHRDKRGAG